jgi:ribonuclease HI
MIISNTSLSGNSTSKVSNNSIRDFIILKKFNVTIHHPKAPQIKEVIWHPPIHSWLKCNIDGASKGNPGVSGCGGIFRNEEAEAVICFAEPLGLRTSYHAELCGLMRAVEIAKDMNWSNIWFESDSTLVVLATKKPDKVPWEIRNRWNNAMTMIRSMNYIVTHIYREGNHVADSLANQALSLNSFTVWHDAPLFIGEHYAKNKLGWPSYRFC